ncbi:MAG: hypothetical protein ACRCSB_05610 [Bacteroidales bacterium]
MSKIILLISLIFSTTISITQTQLIENQELNKLPLGRAIYNYVYIDKPFNYTFPMFDTQDLLKIYYFKQNTKHINQTTLFSYSLESKISDSIMLLNSMHNPTISGNNILLFCDDKGLNIIDLNNNYSIYLDTIKGIQIQFSWLSNKYITFIERQKIYTSDGKSVPGGISTLKIIDKNGNVVDTFQNIRPHWSGLSGNVGGKIVYGQRIYGGYGEAMVCLDTYKRSKDTLFITKEETFYPSNIVWNPINLNEVFWTCSKGIYKINIQTKEIELIKQGFFSRSYEYFDISPNGRKIIVQRWDKVQMPDIATIKRECNIYL